MIETNEERLARLTALIDDGWCPCRSSAGDAGWLAEQVAQVTRQRDAARAEVDRLRDKLASARDAASKLSCTKRDLRAEVDRLRGELKAASELVALYHEADVQQILLVEAIAKLRDRP